MAKKTVGVEWVKDKTNELLALSADEMEWQRRGAASLLEAILFETGNYKGYSFLSSEWDEDTQTLRMGFDDSRRKYM